MKKQRYEFRLNGLTIEKLGDDFIVRGWHDEGLYMTPSLRKAKAYAKRMSKPQ